MLSFLKALWRTARFEHALLLAVAIIAAYFDHTPLLSEWLALGIAAAILSEIAAFSINDYADRETDRINKKDTPLVKGEISPHAVLLFSLSSLIASSLLALALPLQAGAVVIFANLFSLLYNFVLKRVPLAGNLYVAFTMALPFIFGGFLAGSNLNSRTLLFALIAFVAGLGREIIKSIEDMEGDAKFRKTLPLAIGEKKALWIARALYFLALILSFLVPLKPPFHLLLIIAAFVIFGAGFSNYKKSRKLSLAGMSLATLSYLLNVFL